MITILIQILVVLVVLIVVYYIVKIAASQFGIPDVIVQIIGLVLALVFLLWVLNAVGISLPGKL